MPKELDYDEVQSYMEGLLAPRPAELAHMEAYARAHDFPIIGPVAGQLCYQMARIIGARRIFELGSGFGYSTAWFARAVQENGGGEVHHVVWDEMLSREARQHLTTLGYAKEVSYHIGEAVETLQQTEGQFDLIFNDIDKHGYPASLPVIARKLRRGGLLIIDNVLWHGRIFNPKDTSADTLGVHEVTRMLTTDPAWIVTIAPVRDGMIVALRQ